MKTAKHLVLACITSAFLCMSCGKKQATTSGSLPEPPRQIEVRDTVVLMDSILVDTAPLPDFAPLIFSVQLGIHPSQQNWVLYQYGSYMLYNTPLSEAELIKRSNKRLKAALVTPQTTVQKSTLAKGWIVSFGNTGIYNYVTKKQMGEGIKTKAEIIAQAEQNVILDQQQLNMIKINQQQ